MLEELARMGSSLGSRLGSQLSPLSAVEEAEIDAKLGEVAEGLELNAYGYDKWGFSPAEVRKTMGLQAWLYRRYFRVEVHGIERVPAGRALLIGNHSSILAYDEMMVATSMLLDASPPRAVRAMIEKFFQNQPFVNVMMARSGQLTGLPENCERLLFDDQLIMVFPEGARGGGNLFWERYELQRFGQGFMRLALRTGAPIVPFAFIGGEECCPALFNVKPLARLLGFPYAPITPTILPLPLPAKCSIHYGEPMCFEGRGDEEDAEVFEKVAAVRARIESLIEVGLAQREGIFF